MVKLLHSVNNELTDRDFDKLTHRVENAIYRLDPEIEDIYEIHIDMINDDWHIEFVIHRIVLRVVNQNAWLPEKP